MMRCFLTGILFLFVQSLIGQRYLTSTSIVPEKDMFYLENWHLTGEVKSVRIRVHAPRNPAMRYAGFDSCREKAKPGVEFSVSEERYDFNRQGKLVKITRQRAEGKVITLFSYNYFGKVSAIESLDKLIVFLYDLQGKLVRMENRSGAKTETYSEIIYKGDSVITVYHDPRFAQLDSLIERQDSAGRTFYSCAKTATHDKRETFTVYDEQGRVVKQHHSTGQYFEYVYDKEGRLLQSYVGPQREFMASYEYDLISGIVKTTRMELIHGQYVARNYECKCTAIDGKNNPIKSEFIDCDTSRSQASFCLNQFYEVEYDYFK
jgi:YD repeat-containing protein